MDGNFSMRIKSSEFQKIRKQFDRLVERTQNKVVSQAVRETLKPVLAAARAKIPRGETGMLKKATKLKIKGYKRNSIVVGIVGVSRMSAVVNGLKVKPSKYAHLVEFGTKAHGPKEAKIMARKGGPIFGRHVRGTTARPFLRPTFDASKTGMERDVRTKIGRGIESLARSL